jgi:membrane-associated phospholipid phosphatase
LAEMRRRRDWWAVDKVVLAYLAGSAVLVAIFWRTVPDAGWRIGAYIAAASLVVSAARAPQRRPVLIFRYWYPLPYVGSLYKDMSVLIPAIRHSSADALLAAWDFEVWGAHPTVWLERVNAAWLTELLQIVYSLFVPAVLVVAFLLWRQGRLAEFRYYGFLIALGFLSSYVGYILVPARGPRFLLRGYQHVELHGLWLFEALQHTLDRLESAHYDCFPSGHTELTILAWWESKRISAGLFRAFTAYTLLIVFATVYLRYHYTIDLLAGAALATALLVLAPPLYRKLGRTA